MPRLAPLASVATAAILMLAPASPAQRDDPRIDPATGQDQRVWPPDPLFDYQHLRLDITIPDMAKPQFSARQTLRLAPVGAPRSSLRLRAGKGLAISSVSLGQQPLDFSHADEVLTITLPRPMPPAQSFTLAIDYTANRPGGGGKGMTFSRDDPNTPEFDPMLHTQGQPETNHLWFPIHDFPNVRLTSEIVATVPEGFQAVSNGRLLSTRSRRPAGGSGTVTYHWLQDKPHAPYLIVLCVGRFDVVNVGGRDTARPGLWLPVYGPLGSADVLRRNFANTPDMIAHFERLFDEPFPWDKYANVVCRNFAAGAMENTSCTTFAPFAATAGPGAVAGVNAHELVHQWFGDLVGYKGWEHVWLGEGWATYGEALWAERARSAASYQRAVAGNASMARLASRASFPQVGGTLVTSLYGNPDSRFNPAVAYAKGGWFLHTLRKRLGDDAFFKGVALYLDRHRMQQVETDDFRRALEDASGLSLEREFHQFTLRPGLPRLRFDLDWDEQAGALGVTAEQIQPIDADNPAFAVSVPILADLGDGESRTLRLDTDARLASAVFPLPRKPAKVVVDPDLTVMGELRIRQNLDQPAAWWLDQLRHGPTEFARLQAAEHLAELDARQLAAALPALLHTLLSPIADTDARRSAAAAMASILVRPATAGAPPSLAASTPGH
jgi:aminopeptidase N